VNVLERVLLHQQAILADRGRWTRGALARSLTDEPVVPLSERAWRWSLSGAIAPALLQVLGPTPSPLAWQRMYDAAVEVLWRELPAEQPRSKHIGLDLDGFNDYPGTHHEDVLDIVERALHAARCPTSAPAWPQTRPV
jgi:hypothetical protein